MDYIGIMIRRIPAMDRMADHQDTYCLRGVVIHMLSVRKELSFDSQ